MLIIAVVTTKIVNEMCLLVDSEFQRKQQERNELVDRVKEKEDELLYCEDQTRKQAGMLSVLCSSIFFKKTGPSII